MSPDEFVRFTKQLKDVRKAFRAVVGLLETGQLQAAQEAAALAVTALNRFAGQQ